MPIPSSPLHSQTYLKATSLSAHTIPYAVPAGQNRATVVRIVMLNANNTAIQSVVLDPTGLNISLHKQTGADAGVSGHPNTWIYTLADAEHPPAATYNIVVTLSNVAPLIAYVDTWPDAVQTGLNTADSLGAPTPVGGTSATATITAAGSAGGMILDCLGVYGTGTVTATPDAAQAQDYAPTPTLSGAGAGGFSHKAGAASVSMSWALTGQFHWSYAAIALAPASTNTAPTVEIDEKASIGSAIYLPVGGSIQLHATITDPDAADAGLTPTWSSDTPAVATVDASTGVVTAVAEGQAVITASTTDTAGASGSDTITILVDNSPATGGTTILGDDMKSQELREAGVDTTVNVALYDSTGNQLTTNPVVAGDITISINNAAPTTLVGNAGLGALVMVNGLLPIPLDATELPTAGDRVTLLIQDKDGTAYRTRSIEILVFNTDPAVGVTAPTNFSALAITGAGAVTAGTVGDKTGYALTSAERTSIASSVWGNATRSLTTFGTLVADIWANATRTLTDKLGFGLSSAERTAIRAEMEGAGTKLSTATTAAAAIQAKTDNLPASPAAVGSAMTLEAGQSAAIADAILGRNLAGGADGGATVGAALKGEMTLTMTSADHTAALSIGGVQVVSGTYVRNSDGTLTITLA